MNTNKEDINSERWLDCARTIAIVLVTFNHAVNRGFSSQPYEEYLLRTHMITMIHAILNVMSRMGVPLFLMITGALLLKRDYTDSIEWFVDSFGSDELDRVIKEGKVSFDEDAIVDEVIDQDGIAHSLSTYDGEEIDLGDGLFAYRTN